MSERIKKYKITNKSAENRRLMYPNGAFVEVMAGEKRDMELPEGYKLVSQKDYEGIVMRSGGDDEVAKYVVYDEGIFEVTPFTEEAAKNDKPKKVKRVTK